MLLRQLSPPHCMLPNTLLWRPACDQLLPVLLFTMADDFTFKAQCGRVEWDTHTHLTLTVWDGKVLVHMCVVLAVSVHTCAHARTKCSLNAHAMPCAQLVPFHPVIAHRYGYHTTPSCWTPALRPWHHPEVLFKNSSQSKKSVQNGANVSQGTCSVIFTV